jgi:DNA mismatch endonuclease (patch repair protein)
MLHRLGYRFRLHRKDLPGTPDIAFPARRRVVFVHGCFWHGHGCPRGGLPASNLDFWQRKVAANRERDSAAKKELQRTGWNVLTVWECETKDRAKLLKKLTRFLDKIPVGRIERSVRMTFRNPVFLPITNRLSR